MTRLLSLLFALLLLAPAAGAAPSAFKAGVFDPPRAAPEIVLPASNGGEFKLSRYRGKVVVLEFGYTHCADVCPVSLATLTQARQKLGAAAADVQVVFITVDPARDNAARLRTYLAPFDPGFIGVTGTRQQIEALLKSYGITATKRMVDGSKTDYTMHHSSYLYFIDRQGMQRAMMPFGRGADDYVHDLQLLLKP
ncbi:MAG: SCO family protein [Pseudomonadota bacterium]